jgi:phosphatidylinositol glycan class V
MSSHDVHHPRRNLFGAFIAWKSFLLLIAVGSSVGPAYDTSSTLIPPHVSSFQGPTKDIVATFQPSALDLATTLTRWDAIYFVQAARRGYVFEQEWAFGSGLSFSISLLVKGEHRRRPFFQITSCLHPLTGLKSMGYEDSGSLEAWAGIVIANLSHLLAVLVLYQLGLTLCSNKRRSFLAAMLHVLSPAGLFMSAPYAESTCAWLSFLGYFLFAHGILATSQNIFSDASILVSGIVFGLATTFRTNALLNGTPFAIYAIVGLSRLVKSPTFVNLRRLVTLGLGGLCVAMGSIGPQTVAYRIFCPPNSTTELRSWCAKGIPSIYNFIQARYWLVHRILNQACV